MNDISKIICSTNRYKPTYLCMLNQDILPYVLEYKYKIFIFPRVLNDLSRGLLKFTYNDTEDVYYLDMYADTMHGHRLRINNVENYMLKSIYGNMPIKAYKDSKEYINNTTEEIELYGKTINGYLDMCILTGETKISDDEDENGCKYFIHINKLNLQSNDGNVSNDSINIDLRRGLKSLPNGIKDMIFINGDLNYCYALINVYYKNLTGIDENIVKQEAASDREYSLFFIKCDNAAYGNSNDNLLCNIFDVDSYNNIIQRDYHRECIALSNDKYMYGSGFWLKLPKSKADTVEDLRNLLNSYKGSVTVIYPLSKVDHDIITLDNYKLKTYYPKTFIRNTDGYNISYFYKTLGI